MPDSTIPFLDFPGIAGDGIFYLCSGSQFDFIVGKDKLDEGTQRLLEHRRKADTDSRPGNSPVMYPHIHR